MRVVRPRDPSRAYFSVRRTARGRTGRGRRAAASTGRRASRPGPARSSTVKSSMRTPRSISFQVTGVDTRRLGPRPDRIDRRERAAPGVLVVVDQHAAARTLGDAVLGRDERRVAARQLLRQRLGKRPHLLLQRAAHDRHVDVQPLRSGRLHERRHLQRVERLADDAAPVSSTRSNVGARRPDRDRSAGSPADRHRRSARTTGSDRCSRD